MLSVVMVIHVNAVVIHWKHSSMQMSRILNAHYLTCIGNNYLNKRTIISL